MTRLFDEYFNELPNAKPKPTKTCRTCKHRQRWECGGRIVQYCSVRNSKRTQNHLLKIKVTNKACSFYEEMEGK